MPKQSLSFFNLNKYSCVDGTLIYVYTIRYTAIFKILLQIAVNEQWRYIEVWL
jgi:hypothetical protein